jgi:hypothetical protein
VVGAINIALGGAVNHPEVALVDVETVLHGQDTGLRRRAATSPPSLGVGS